MRLWHEHVEILRTPPRQRVLVFAPHADDEVLGCGGTILLHAARGDAVHVVIAFDGLLGLAAPWPRDTRRVEAARAASALGVAPYRFLDHPEGHVPTAAEAESGARQLAALVDEFSPDVVYAPWPGEEHVDHRTLAQAVASARALCRRPVEWWGFEVWTPLAAERVLDVESVWPRKLEALCAYASQGGATELARLAEERASARRELFGGAATRSEGFARLPRGAP
ncbi:MAG TPA: PIG-L family deacetylase [Planctomycetota bacterium]|nr:PIG-L family deacetylase [Planctomycetota bacterium]